MSWTFNSVRIFVQNYGGTDKQTIARLGPVNDRTVLHVFGYESPIVKVTAKVVGVDDLNTLRGMVRTGLQYSLTKPYASPSNYYLNSIDWKMDMSICQTLRPDLATDAPVWTVEMELYYDG